MRTPIFEARSERSHLLPAIQRPAHHPGHAPARSPRVEHAAPASARTPHLLALRAPTKMTRSRGKLPTPGEPCREDGHEAPRACPAAPCDRVVRTAGAGTERVKDARHLPGAAERDPRQVHAEARQLRL